MTLVLGSLKVWGLLSTGSWGSFTMAGHAALVKVPKMKVFPVSFLPRSYFILSLHAPPPLSL